MEENTTKFEIKIDPLDLHVGLKDEMAEFESLIRMKNPGKKLAEQVEKELHSRFCHCCFFGHVEGVLMGEPLCKECAKILYGFDENEEHPRIKKIDPYYQLWYRRRKVLPIFEAYLHSEIERYKLEQKLEDEIAELKDKLREQTSIAEEGWKEFRTYHTSYAEAVKELYDKNKEIAELKEKHKTEVKELLCLIRDKENNFNRAFDSVEKELRHQKYKRCLDNAWGCQQRMELFHELALEEARTIALPNEVALKENRRKRERAAKWHNRWIKIAEQFKDKEAK